MWLLCCQWGIIDCLCDSPLIHLVVKKQLAQQPIYHSDNRIICKTIWGHNSWPSWWHPHLVSQQTPQIASFHVANMGPNWALLSPGGPHVGPMTLRVSWIYPTHRFKKARKLIECLFITSCIVMWILRANPMWILKLVHHWFRLNSLAPGKCEWNFRYLIFQIISVIDGWGISCELAFIWMSLNLTYDKSTLVQVMAWCCQATSHYLSQCWPRSL